MDNQVRARAHKRNIGIFNEAASRAFPNAGSCYYEQVYVLLLSWEDDKLGVIEEIKKLHRVFEKLYGYSVESWLIPSEESH